MEKTNSFVKGDYLFYKFNRFIYDLSYLYYNFKFSKKIYYNK